MTARSRLPLVLGGTLTTAIVLVLLLAVQMTAVAAPTAKPVGDTAAIHHNLAQLYLRLQQHDLAMRHVDQAIAINPSAASSYVTRGRIYEAVGQGQRAFQEFKKAWQGGFNMVGLYNRWAEQAMLANEPARAAVYLNDALKLAPADRVIMENLRSVRQSLQPGK